MRSSRWSPISEELQARSFVEATFERWGRVDVLVGNAGYGLRKPFFKTSVDEIQAQLQTNYGGRLRHQSGAGANGVRGVAMVVVVSVVAAPRAELRQLCRDQSGARFASLT